MKHFVNGDQVVITLDDFIDLQLEKIQSITDEDAEEEGILCGLHEWDCLFSKN